MIVVFSIATFNVRIIDVFTWYINILIKYTQSPVYNGSTV